MSESLHQHRPLLGTRCGCCNVGSQRDKTATVVVEFKVRHPKYGKYIRRRRSFSVHDERTNFAKATGLEIGSCLLCPRPRATGSSVSLRQLRWQVDAFVQRRCRSRQG
ncbi:UNVERIFIED_CONTAM: hypothetical protein GTU68_045464 [Idotea baltica]|nr:hypothetical protein [Idotea baltica]